ncbi:MAG: hypothetical protein IJR00_03310 [Lachnospiraceae bacterium]|nr:hypothetical protein [Lachnospiraceae bacterium]
MVKLFKKDLISPERRSSKGNQLKWRDKDVWYKADYAGYEGLSEYLISHLLRYSDLQPEEYVLYELEEISYGSRVLRGVRSRNFLPDGWQLITLERLFRNVHTRSFASDLYGIRDHRNRLRFLVDQVVQMTGLKDFGIYMNRILTIDTLFLNEDRHLHNVAVLLDENGEFHYCPAFDHGAALLSDTALDYPMGEDIYQLMEKARPKTFLREFDEQMEISEELYGSHLSFSFDKKTVRTLLEQAGIYEKEITYRVETIIYEQMRRYEPYIRKKG